MVVVVDGHLWNVAPSAGGLHPKITNLPSCAHLIWVLLERSDWQCLVPIGVPSSGNSHSSQHFGDFGWAAPGQRWTAVVASTTALAWLSGWWWVLGLSLGYFDFPL